MYPHTHTRTGFHMHDTHTLLHLDNAHTNSCRASTHLYAHTDTHTYTLSHTHIHPKGPLMDSRNGAQKYTGAHRLLSHTCRHSCSHRGHPPTHTGASSHGRQTQSKIKHPVSQLKTHTHPTAQRQRHHGLGLILFPMMSQLCCVAPGKPQPHSGHL